MVIEHKFLICSLYYDNGTYSEFYFTLAAE